MCRVMKPCVLCVWSLWCQSETTCICSTCAGPRHVPAPAGTLSVYHPTLRGARDFHPEPAGAPRSAVLYDKHRDGGTDTLIANVTLTYIVWPIITQILLTIMVNGWC